MTNAPPTTRLHLHEHPVSSYAQKIKIALRHKSIPFTSSLPEALTNPDSTSASATAFATANPRLEVPMLTDTSTSPPLAIFDSTIILQYIEDTHPTAAPLLLPALSEEGAAAIRANARMIEEVCDTHYEAVNWGLGEMRWFGRAGPDGGELRVKMEGKAVEHTKVLQGWLEGKLVEAGGEWFGGREFGYADCCVAPIVNRSVHYGLGPEKEGVLGRWIESCRQIKAVRETFDEFENGLKGMSDPRVKEAFLTGQRKREYRDHRLEWMVKSGGLGIVEEGIKRGNVRFSWPE